ncbi:MAG: RdgB/HAM1 family non-canonical purine NTP pyrophosphatase [bacterium]
MEIILASFNAHKAREVGEIMAPVAVKSLKEFGVAIDFDAVEDGETYEENAFKKARAAAAHVAGIIAADDSGLEVDALDGRPGLLSARYGGAEISDFERCRLLLEEMKDVPDGRRGARFVCKVAVLFSDGRETLYEGECRGIITRELRGSGGFGYDPVLFLPDRGLTVADLSAEEKNEISHRAIAFRALRSDLMNKWN